MPFKEQSQGGNNTDDDSDRRILYVMVPRRGLCPCRRIILHNCGTPYKIVCSPPPYLQNKAQPANNPLRRSHSTPPNYLNPPQPLYAPPQHPPPDLHPRLTDLLLTPRIHKNRTSTHPTADTEPRNTDARNGTEQHPAEFVPE